MGERRKGEPGREFDSRDARLAREKVKISCSACGWSGSLADVEDANPPFLSYHVCPSCRGRSLDIVESP